MQQINGVLTAPSLPRTVGWISIGESGFIHQSRIVWIGSVNTAPMRRLLQELPSESMVLLTGGRRRETAVLLDSGHVIITALSLSEWQALLQEE